MRNTSRANILALVLLALVFLAVSFIRRVDNPAAVLTSDVRGYYMYLPTLFIEKDVHKMPAGEFIGRCTNDKGEGYTKYSCGTAYCYLPFFLAAHAYAKISGQDASGFSTPYCYGIMIGGVFWAFIGLYFLLRLLLRYFQPRTAWLAIISIVLGTNYFNYATLENGMSHIYSFALFAAALYGFDHYYKHPSAKLAIILGALVGWIVLLRPTNAIFIIFVILYRVITVGDLKQRFAFFVQQYRHILLAIAPALLVVLPQVLYWHAMTGHWIKYSYDNEHFIYWANPKIARVLFDTRNGLFLYSPVLLFAVWGATRRRDPRSSTPAILIVFALATYTFASWWAYWFGGAYGHRCYVEYYALFSLPMAVSMERLLALREKWLKYALLFVLLFFCYYSVYFSQLYMRDTIFGGPEWEWNWDTWIKYFRQTIGLQPIRH